MYINKNNIEIGIDIEEIIRFNIYVKNIIYAQRIFTKEEISYAMSKKYKIAQYFTAFFAAKEAVWKALNNHYTKLLITDIAIQHNKIGKPIVYIKSQHYDNIDISLSHTKSYVVAVAIVCY
ncbi:MAG: 4'-phosphopantetheinyl transferase superfamily protein [Endomicrobium sp.]|jgi:holo-[acyl-carrier protein] synthase|nr:4'-phosphopantetheinyl transferase superfamily protein [Endomicrobium sp.]